MNKRGFKVAIVARDPDKLRAFETKFGPGVTKGFPCDVTNRQHMERTISQIEVDLGPIHTIVYNAGRGVFKKYTEVTEDDFERCVNVNAKGLLMAAQLACLKMEKKGKVLWPLREQSLLLEESFCCWKGSTTNGCSILRT